MFINYPTYTVWRIYINYTIVSEHSVLAIPGNIKASKCFGNMLNYLKLMNIILIKTAVHLFQ